MQADELIAELVVANRILASQNVVDAFGHVSVRSAKDPKRFFLSRARAPECVEAGDIMEFALDGTAIDARGRKPYLERFIHAALYELRPDVNSVVHNHSYTVIPFGITGKKLRPVMHVCSMIGTDVPVWDSQDHFKDTDLLVSDMDMGRDLAKCLGGGTVALMRGHGATVVGRSLREAVHTSVYLQVNADLQLKAVQLAGEGAIRMLTAGEIEIRNSIDPTFGIERAWESWRRRAEI
jgi:ribulose-5-phosphate 4-epimerase/fuculose-1-phosphate aldolase